MYLDYSDLYTVPTPPTGNPRSLGLGGTSVRFRKERISIGARKILKITGNKIALFTWIYQGIRIHMKLIPRRISDTFTIGLLTRYAMGANSASQKCVQQLQQPVVSGYVPY